MHVRGWPQAPEAPRSRPQASSEEGEDTDEQVPGPASGPALEEAGAGSGVPFVVEMPADVKGLDRLLRNRSRDEQASAHE